MDTTKPSFLKMLATTWLIFGAVYAVLHFISGGLLTLAIDFVVISALASLGIGFPLDSALGWVPGMIVITLPPAFLLTLVRYHFAVLRAQTAARAAIVQPTPPQVPPQGVV